MLECAEVERITYRNGARIILALFSACAALCATGAGVSLDEATVAVRNWLARGYALGLRSCVSVADARTAEDAATGARLHVVSLDGGGYVVTAADDLAGPVLAFSPTGETFEQNEANPLWNLLRRDISARIEYAGGASRSRLLASAGSSTQASTAEPTASQRRWTELLANSGNASSRLLKASGASSIADIRVDSFVASRWGQDTVSGKKVFNLFTPKNYVCGCVATMLAQMMRYWQWPKSSVAAKTYMCTIDGARSYRTMMGGIYDWSSMPHTPEASITDAQCTALGKLTYDIGVAVQMQWSSQGSGAYLSEAQRRLADTFGYAQSHTLIYHDKDPYSLEKFKRIVIPNCEARLPVGMGIYGAKAGGHAVVIDGYGYSDGEFFIHINCGWRGSQDAWYAPPEIVTSTYTFDVIDGLIFNISPQSTGSICSGRVLLDGKAVAGASVTLTGQNGNVAAVCTTDERGIYAFVAPAGTYTIFASAQGAAVSKSLSIANTAGTRLSTMPGYFTQGASSIGNVYDQDLMLVAAQIDHPVPIPYSWFEKYYPGAGTTAADYATLAQSDTDGDGFAAWQEYVANTDPTNAQSRLTCAIRMSDDGTPVVTAIPAEAHSSYPRQLQGKNILTDEWTNLEEASRAYRFYRITIPHSP